MDWGCADKQHEIDEHDCQIAECDCQIAECDRQIAKVCIFNSEIFFD